MAKDEKDSRSLVISQSGPITSHALKGKSGELIASILSGEIAGEIKVSKEGAVRVKARDESGAVITMSSYVNPQTGYREMGGTELPNKMKPSQRKGEAMRLAKDGYTQSEIAERLGVSQKTISNDLQ